MPETFNDCLRATVLLPAVTLAMAQVGLASAAAQTGSPSTSESVTTWVTPAITDHKIMPEDPPPADRRRALLRMTAAPGEIESGSFVVYAHEPVDELLVNVSALTGTNGSLNAKAVDIRTVKRWYQASFSAGTQKKYQIFTPELLLKNDALVRVTDGENYVLLESGDYAWISEVDPLARRRPVPVEEMPIRDTAELQPLDLPQGRNKQCWVTLRVAPLAKPGNYSALLSIRYNPR